MFTRNNYDLLICGEQVYPFLTDQSVNQQINLTTLLSQQKLISRRGVDKHTLKRGVHCRNARCYIISENN